MNLLEIFFFNNFRYTALNKYFFTSLKKVPKIKKIVLTLKISKYKIKDLALNFLILELIQNITSNTRIQIIKTKKPNLILKLRKGTPIGCKIIINSSFQIFEILNKLNINITLFNKTSKKNITKQLCKIDNSLTIPIKNVLSIKQINRFYNLFINNHFNFNINIFFSNKLKQEISFVYKFLTL